MESFLLNTALEWAAPYLTFASVYIAGGLTLAGILHTIATGVLRPFAKWTPNKTDDRYVELAVWWSDAIADVLRDWSLGRWVAGWRRGQRMLEDRSLPLTDRRWE